MNVEKIINHYLPVLVWESETPLNLDSLQIFSLVH